MDNLKITRSEFVEIAVGSTSTNATIYFPDLPNLRNTRTWGLSAYNTLSLSSGLQNENVISLAQTKQCLVYLYFENGLFIVQPLSSFVNISNDVNNGSGTASATSFFQLPVQLNGQKITWSKSYIQITNAAAVSGFASHSFLFNVYYTLN